MKIRFQKFPVMTHNISEISVHEAIMLLTSFLKEACFCDLKNFAYVTLKTQTEIWHKSILRYALQNMFKNNDWRVEVEVKVEQH